MPFGSAHLLLALGLFTARDGPPSGRVKSVPAASTALPVGVECAAKSRCWRNGGGGGDDCRRKYGSDGDAETDDDERSWTGFFTVIYRVSMLVGLYWMSCMLIDKTNPHSMLILKTGFRTCEISNSLLSE